MFHQTRPDRVVQRISRYREQTLVAAKDPVKEAVLPQFGALRSLEPIAGELLETLHEPYRVCIISGAHDEQMHVIGHYHECQQLDMSCLRRSIEISNNVIREATHE
ncbi:MAG: hypothetical protein M3P30_06100 [Chloroflexota bacterium]|nr:hypothetical protein [Chloroflexota bacterium]